MVAPSSVAARNSPSFAYSPRESSSLPTGARLTGEQAWDTYERLVTDGRVDFELHEPPGLEGLWRRFTSRALASPKLWMDAYLAAFAVAGGLSFVTSDSGFRQFPGLTLVLLGE